MSRVLIVGSEGQIGTQLSKALSNRDDFDQLFLCDIKDKSRTDLNYFKVDALSYDDLKSFIIDKKINEVYHLAERPYANMEPEYEFLIQYTETC
jgi:nucleoside-diphosphate-sugar epimerase